jgi:hypothetical protein
VSESGHSLPARLTGEFVRERCHIPRAEEVAGPGHVDPTLPKFLNSRELLRTSAMGAQRPRTSGFARWLVRLFRWMLRSHPVMQATVTEHGSFEQRRTPGGGRRSSGVAKVAGRVDRYERARLGPSARPDVGGCACRGLARTFHQCDARPTAQRYQSANAIDRPSHGPLGKAAGDLDLPESSDAKPFSDAAVPQLERFRLNAGNVWDRRTTVCAHAFLDAGRRYVAAELDVGDVALGGQSRVMEPRRRSDQRSVPIHGSALKAWSLPTSLLPSRNLG